MAKSPSKSPSKAPNKKPKQGSFHIEQEVFLGVPPRKAWDALLDVQGWWVHHFNDSRPTMNLEPVPGGRFMETGKDCDVLWGTVMHVKKPELIRIWGPLGMARLPVHSVYDFALAPAKGGTMLTLTHRASGLLDPSWHKAHEKGWQEMWPKLKALAERGERLRD